MTTDRDSDYHKVRFGIWLPESFVSEWKRFLSRKWPEYNHGIQSLEVQLAMKRWMESEGRSAHTHKDTVLMEAENKPNFHTRKKGVVSKLTPTPAPTPLPPIPIVISNNGKSSGEEKEKSEDIFDWTKRMVVIVEPKDTEQANKIRAIPNIGTKLRMSG